MAINGLEGSESWRVNHGRELARVILGKKVSVLTRWPYLSARGREKEKRKGGAGSYWAAAEEEDGPRVG